MPARTIEVAVTVVRNEAGRILMAERTQRQLSPGCWELPGGKLERGETAEQAARRELAEEAGVVAETLRPLTRYAYDFPTARVIINAFEATAWRGEPYGREGQKVAWVAPGVGPAGPLLPSVAAVFERYAAAEIIELCAPASRALAQAQAALDRGARRLHLSAGRLAPDQSVTLARRIGALAQRFGARVFLAGTALEAGRAGVETGARA